MTISTMGKTSEGRRTGLPCGVGGTGEPCGDTSCAMCTPLYSYYAPDKRKVQHARMDCRRGSQPNSRRLRRQLRATWLPVATMLQCGTGARIEMPLFQRITWIVLDSVGIGALPDAADYDDVGRNTLGHIAESRPLKIPNLLRLGLANIAPLQHLQPAVPPPGARGKGATPPLA